MNSRTFHDKALRLFFGLSVLEGIICLIILMLIPADSTDTWLFGYSKNRVMLYFVFLAGILLFSSLLVIIWNKKGRVPTLMDPICSYLQDDKGNTILLGFLSIGFVLSIIYLGFAFTNLDYRVPKDAITSMEEVKAYMLRLAPFFIWSAMICGQAIGLLTTHRVGTRFRYLQVLKGISVIIFPVFTIIFLVFNQIDPYYYNLLTKEDNYVEWLTVIFLFLAGLIAFYQAWMSRKNAKRYIWFYVLFGTASILFASEEISWGQRIFGVESPEIFMEYSDQQEINIHNVVNKVLGVRTKHISAWTLFVYGVVLSTLAGFEWVHTKLDKLGVVIPPKVLIPGFILASTMTWDRYFSGQDEEVAELFFSILIFLIMIFQFWVQQPVSVSIENQAIN